MLNPLFFLNQSIDKFSKLWFVVLVICVSLGLQFFLLIFVLYYQRFWKYIPLLFYQLIKFLNLFQTYVR